MIWIVHPDPRIQRFLARLCGEGELWMGAADATDFPGEPAPEVVVLGAADVEGALEFAHRVSGSHPRAGWVLIREPGVGEAELRARFAGLDAQILPYPPDPPALRAALRVARTGHSRAESLGERRHREAVASRFARYFQDLALPDIEQVRRASRGLLVRGEPGTGRLLFARAAHLLAGGGPFLHLPCDAHSEAAELGHRITAAATGRHLTLCLENLDRVSPELQRELVNWIELGVPRLPLAPEDLRWVATIDEHGALLPELIDALAPLPVHLPPLRERPEAIRPFALATVEQWTRARGIERRLGEDALTRLEAWRWPGNLRELESVVLRLLASADGPEIDAAAVDALLRSPLDTGTDPLRGAPQAVVAAPHETPRAVPEEEGLPEATVLSDEEPTEAPRGAELRELAAALAHELRNPLVSVRTFAELLPERFDDPEFRTAFRDHARLDLALVEERLARLACFSELGPGEPLPVNVTALLDRKLEQRREEIRRRRLLVLRELETEAPWARSDAPSLDFVFDCLLSLALRERPGSSDLYLASRRQTNVEGKSMLRVLFRFRDGALGSGAGELVPSRHSLDLWLARAAAAIAGARMRVDQRRAEEIVVSLELPAAPAHAGPEGAPSR